MALRDEVDVLIVDDREDGLIALEAVLGELPNVNIVKANSGAEALSLLPAHDFAVILLDVQMPQMDGFETAAAIRARATRYQTTPIIFVTAINKDDQYIFRGYQAGAVDYVFKPFDPLILRSKVSVFIDLFVKSRQLQVQNDLIREGERRERYLKLAELEVESLKRYRNLADAIPHIVWKAKADGTLDYFNKVWTDYTGILSDQSLGSGWQDALEPEDLKVFLKSWISAMGVGEAFEIECRIRRFDGDMRWHWIRAVPEVRHEEVVSWLGTCTDIHDRKLSEVRLLAAQKAAILANEAKTNFLANMSHEIRTPMGAILGFAELLKDPKQSPEQREHSVATIRRSGQQLLNIIDEILDISKVEAGRLQIESIETNLVSILFDLEAMLSVQCERKGINLKFRLDSKLPEFIFSDPTRIRQVLMNIIGNAIKFTAQGEVQVTFRWNKVTDSEGSLTVEVTDTGVGIDLEHIGNLFQPFAQVDSSMTRKFGGTGLGLALSKKLARALGGDIRLVKTQIGIGSTFEISFAASVKDDSRWTDRLLLPALDKKPDMESVENVLEGVKVLLVEDAPENQTIIGLFLSSAGATVDFADNGEEGVQKALGGDYNVVLMDIQMPFLDGYQATSFLREKGFQKPIVALTAHALKEERDRCLRVGCTDHFTKPVDRLKLINLVNQLSHGSPVH